MCALVRNDMQILARCQRLQGRFSGSKPAVPRYYAGRRQISTCHCEERSDVAIRSPAVGHSKEQYSGRIPKASRIRPKWYQLARLLCGENGLPRLVAPKSAMPSSGQRPEQGNAPLGLLSPQSVPLCGAPWLCRPRAGAGQRSLGAPLPAKGTPLRGPRHWFAMTC